jgi:hypothetical protein
MIRAEVRLGRLTGSRKGSIYERRRERKGVSRSITGQVASKRQIRTERQTYNYEALTTVILGGMDLGRYPANGGLATSWRVKSLFGIDNRSYKSWRGSRQNPREQVEVNGRLVILEAPKAERTKAINRASLSCLRQALRQAGQFMDGHPASGGFSGSRDFRGARNALAEH